jgi:soluble lytic murein transglycosylase
MRLVPWLALAVVCACSGDDNHRHTRTPKPAPVEATTTPAATPASTTPVVTGPAAELSEAAVASYWTSPDELAGAAKFSLEEYRAAASAFQRARAATKDDQRIARIDVVLGLCYERMGDNANAAKHFTAAHPKLPQLADYIGYHAARALWLTQKTTEALALAQTVAKDSIVGADAELLVGDLLRGKGDWPAVVTHFRDYLARRPNGPFRSEARFDLAEAIEKTGGDRNEAIQLYRKIAVDDPLSSWMVKSKARLAELNVPNTWNAAEHIARGMEYFDAMHNPESEAAFNAALADPKITPAEKCTAAYHRAQSRFKARDRKGASVMFDDAATACKAAANTDLWIKSHYQAGRSYAFIGQHQVAITHYQAAQVVDPKHSYSDDSLLREAEEWASLNNGAKVDELLSSLPKKFPAGDSVAESMWRVGWRAWGEKRYDDAIKWWKEQIRLVPRDDNYFAEGQPQYWLGRAYAVKGQMPEAIAQWQVTVRQYPAAYYALLALNRLRENAPKEYEALVKEISADPPGFDPAAPAFVFKARPEWGAPGFLRAMEFLRLGIGSAAEPELKKLGLTAPPGKSRVNDPDQIEKLWAMAFLYDKAERYATSLWPTRWHILDYREKWPVGANRARWLIAYPKGYWQLLSRHAAINKVPIAMQIGIVREESGFSPLTESYANAIGLTQMIPPTAKDFAKGTGIDPTRENLRDPEKNVTIGSRFLGSLFRTFKSFTILIPTAYNAGPGYVKRILKLRSHLAPDEFVESILDDQARNYTKRVTGSFFTYTWLYEKTIPEMPNTFPKDVLP